MRLGFIGPCRGDLAALRPLAEMLLFEVGVDRAIYLGVDDALSRAAKGWPERIGAPHDEDAFLTEALDALLDRDMKLRRLADLAALPPAPSRAVELFDDRVVLMVYDKAQLDEDDVANATAVIWGNSAEAQLRAIGPRVFLTPGWAAGGSVVTVELVDEGIVCTVRDRGGRVRQEHVVSAARGARIGVQ